MPVLELVLALVSLVLLSYRHRELARGRGRSVMFASW